MKGSPDCQQMSDTLTNKTLWAEYTIGHCLPTFHSGVHLQINHSHSWEKQTLGLSPEEQRSPPSWGRVPVQPHSCHVGGRQDTNQLARMEALMQRLLQGQGQVLTQTVTRLKGIPGNTAGNCLSWGSPPSTWSTETLSSKIVSSHGGYI